MVKLETMIVGAWAGEQLPVISGAGVTIGEELFEGHHCGEKIAKLILFHFELIFASKWLIRRRK